MRYQATVEVSNAVNNIHLANLSISYKQRKTFSFLEYFCFTEGNYTNFEILQQENKYIN